MSKKKANPFNTGSPVRGDGFIGSQSILHEIDLFLRHPNQANFLIQGQRHIGKTSLLRKLQDTPPLHGAVVPIYFNLQDKASIPLSQLLYELAKRVILDMDLTITLSTEDFSPLHAANYFQNHFLPLIFQFLPAHKSLLFLFDECDVLGDMEEVEDDLSIANIAAKRFIPFMVNLIEHVQAHNYPVKFIFAIGRNYKDLDQNRFGKITQLGPSEELSCFSKEETFGILNISTAIIPFEKPAMEEVFAITAGHPYFTQCLASSAFDWAEANNAQTITASMVQEQLPVAIKRFSSGIYWVWDSLSPRHRVILYLSALLKEEGKAVLANTLREKAELLNVAPALENLEQTLEELIQFKFLKVVENGHGQYGFYMEFIRKWVVLNIAGMASAVAPLLGK